MHIGASVSYKRWPVNRFLELASKMYSKYGLQTILIGSSNELNLLERYKPLPKEIVNLIGCTKIEELFSLIRKARIVIANDSAIGHIADFERRPLITLYGGPSSTLSFAPNKTKNRLIRKDCLCLSAEQDICRNEKKWCMAEIKVEEVELEVESLILISKNNKDRF